MPLALLLDSPRLIPMGSFCKRNSIATQERPHGKQEIGSPGGNHLDLCARRVYLIAGASNGHSAPANPERTPEHLSPGVPLTWSEVQSLPLPEPAPRIEYGEHPDQFGELRVPPGPGPHPVAVLIHGGCWLQDFDYSYFRHLAAAVAEAGIATWTIEYRRVAGDGGWPMTFLDIADAIDHLRSLSESHPLDLARVAVAGHSAGGHLALWSATRARLDQQSELYRPSPVAIRGVVALAPITDLAAYRIGPAQSCHGAVDRLMGGGPEARPERYADGSPAARLPLGTPIVLVNGAADPIVSADGVRAFAQAAAAAGDDVRVNIIPGAGHFEPSVPGSSAWSVVLDALTRLVQSYPEQDQWEQTGSYLQMLWIGGFVQAASSLAIR